MPISQKMIKYTLTFLLACNVLFLNFGLPICIGMTQENTCQEVQKMHGCCFEKESKTEQVKSSCPCEIKESNAQVDLYIDFRAEHKQFSSKHIYSEAAQNLSSFFLNNHLFSDYHSPPVLYGNDIYLTNLNLRI